LLDCTHFMDFLSFQQGALTPKPPPLSRWVWCYHFPGHSIFGFRPRRCAKQRLLHPQWPKVSLKKNLRKKTLKYSWQRLRLRSALQWEAMEMRKAAFSIDFQHIWKIFSTCGTSYLFISFHHFSTFQLWYLPLYCISQQIQEATFLDCQTCRSVTS